jgi:hypothetical protein
MRPALLVAAVLLAGVRSADACTCARQGPACEDYWTADAIFRGRVDAVDRAAPDDPLRGRLVRFTVLEPFKGLTDPVIEVRTAGSRATCGYPFVKGREYVVYARRVGGALTTGACSRTMPADRAHADLEYARGVAADAGRPLGRISGRVLVRSRDLARRTYKVRPLAGAAIVVRRDDSTWRETTNRSGEFAVFGLEPGRYDVAVDPPGRSRIELDRPSLELRDVRGCATVEAGAYPDGRVTGRVVDAAGPVRGLTLDLTVPDAIDRSGPTGPERLRTVTRGDGSYEFAGVPPGRFLVGINTRPEGSMRIHPTVFHPGVIRASESAALVMAAGGRVELGDLAVPGTIRYVEITGSVVTGTRTPAEGARVYLKGPAERDFIVTEPVLTDLNGRFTIAGLSGAAYALFAEGPERSVRLDATEPIVLTAAPASAPLLLVLRPIR